MDEKENPKPDREGEKLDLERKDRNRKRKITY
jgi:hypothetical protein